MTKEQRLKSEARKAAKFRGHRMEKSWKHSEIYGCKSQFLECEDCGMQVAIELDPAPRWY